MEIDKEYYNLGVTEQDLKTEEQIRIEKALDPDNKNYQFRFTLCSSCSIVEYKSDEQLRREKTDKIIDSVGLYIIVIFLYAFIGYML